MTQPMTSVMRWHSPVTDRMVRHLLVSAVLAGAAAGLIASALQLTFVVPALLEGELFESGERLHFVMDGSPQSERGVPSLDGDLVRHGTTVAFNLVTYLGYGLILTAAMVFSERYGHAVTARSGLVWGLVGFIAVQLAPAIGLPPELPGTPASEVGPRQAWWLFTVVSSAAGLALIAFIRGPVLLAGVCPSAAPTSHWRPAPRHLLGSRSARVGCTFRHSQSRSDACGLGFTWFPLRLVMGTMPRFHRCCLTHLAEAAINALCCIEWRTVTP